MILPSNVAAEAYPQNTSSNYTTVLHRPLEVKRLTGVCLLEIHFSLTFYNVEDDFFITLRLSNGKTQTVHPIGGVYREVEDLRTMLNVILKNTPCRCKLNTTNKLVLDGGNDVSGITVHHKLARIMGIDAEGGNLMLARRDFDPWTNLRVILVNTNAILPSYLNRRMRKVLQSVVLPTEWDFGDTFAETFEPVDYIPFEGEVYSSINISLTDLWDDYIRFRAGTVLVKLAVK